MDRYRLSRSESEDAAFDEKYEYENQTEGNPHDRSSSLGNLERKQSDKADKTDKTDNPSSVDDMSIDEQPSEPIPCTDKIDPLALVSCVFDDAVKALRLQKSSSFTLSEKIKRGDKDELGKNSIALVFQRFPGGERRLFAGIPWRGVIEELAKDKSREAVAVKTVVRNAFRMYTENFRKHCRGYISELNSRDTDLEVSLFDKMSIGQAFTMNAWCRAALSFRDTDLEIVKDAWESFSQGRPYSSAKEKPQQKTRSSMDEMMAQADIRAEQTQLSASKAEFVQSLCHTYTPWKQRVASVKRQEALTCVLWEKHLKTVMRQMNDLGKRVKTETKQLKELVRNGIISEDKTLVKKYRKKRIVEYLEFFNQLEKRAPLDGDVLSYLRRWYEIFRTEDVPKKEDRLQRLQMLYIPLRARAIRSRYLEEWIRRLEDQFTACKNKLTETMKFYEQLPLPLRVSKEDESAVQAVAGCMKKWQQVLLSLLSVVKNKLGEAMEIEGQTSASQAQSEADETGEKIVSTATQLEQMQYIVMKYSELNEFILKSNMDPADSLVDFVKRTVDEHNYYEAVPVSYFRTEAVWQKLELAAIAQLEAEVEEFVAPLMKPFEGDDKRTGYVGGELYVEGARLVQALKQEQIVWGKYNPPVRFEPFAHAEWGLGSDSVIPAIAKKQFRFPGNGADPFKVVLKALAKGLKRTLKNPGFYTKCRLDSKDTQDLLYVVDIQTPLVLEGRTETTLKDTWRLCHILYFATLLVNEQGCV